MLDLEFVVWLIGLIAAISLTVVSRRPTLKRGSGETVYKKFGAAGVLEAPIRSLHFKLIM